ncbi:DUF885 domain-containing protein [Sphingomonas nostoxanthinifaciens]|uniref:DUF885 domain-containing protein n=1 Tax=Sphingomonas nostoxanthinifaciens TaxID=2872652 RepID=UPI001CC20B55|nr:DUF885 family protein [Sphingomonas nostoxanthinifaciens]UAK25036.1 DUF885 family protein [Sphingomonas nostoxanthinifaciens]
MDRRTFTFGAAALAAAGTRAVAAPVANGPDGALQALLLRQFDDYVALTPEFAAGIDKDGRYAAARLRLDDRSQAGKDQQAAIARRWLAELRAFDRSRLSPAMQRDYDIAAFTYENYADLMGRYGFVDMNLRPNPYVVNQMAGAYYWEPEFFSRARMQSPADVDAYLARLTALPAAFDQETARIRGDAARGVIPPDFILARTIVQIAALRDTPAAQSILLREPLAGAKAKGLALDPARAIQLWDGPIRAALDRQVAALKALQPRAKSAAGVWAQPDGEAWYAAALRSNTTTPMPPEEMHRLGLAIVDEITVELEKMLAAQGMTGGALKDRLHALDMDPRMRVPDDDAGRALVLANAHADLEKIFPLLPRAFRSQPAHDIDVRRVPPNIEAGSPGAFYNGGAADGSRPGVISINLQHPQEWPAWRLPTLIHHEGLPGHHLQISIFKSVAARQPAYKQLARFSAYSEGWGLYGQRVADEIGVFEGDPLGRIGYLQSMLWRATRIVVDTGLHHKRWGRRQAVDWMVDHSGEQVTSTEREIDRYCVLPGQACAFMYGQSRIFAARERVRQRLGARFDVGAYHDLVILAGAMPMPVLEAMVDAWDGTPVA